MEIIVHDTLTAQRAILAEPAERREAAYRELLMEPLRGFWERFAAMAPPGAGTGPADPALRAAKASNYFDPRADAASHLAALDRLEAAGAWQGAGEALRLAERAFAAEGHSCLVDRVECALVLANRDDEALMGLGRGYTGFGGFPGYVQIIVWPNGYNLPRLPAAVAHEFHHNVRLSHAPWRPDISVAEYIVLEGLAESFAAALCGPDLLGPWVTTLTDEEMAHSRAVIGRALGVTGFDKVRGYLFGDQPAEAFGYEKTGLPYCAGYTVGYQVVQAYLRNTGRSIVEATFTSAEEIVERSAFFTALR